VTAAIVAVLVATTAVVAIGYFEVQTAFIDDTVDEVSPVAAGTESTQYRGTFAGREHDTTGSAVVLSDANDARFLRFESFETSNGPDVHVFLARDESGVAGAVDLGPLKGNIGDQNYSIPADVDLSGLDTVLVWCVRFSALFGAATLSAA
jgi:FlaG/FlaF family flagellin (archaellin)